MTMIKPDDARMAAKLKRAELLQAAEQAEVEYHETSVDAERKDYDATMARNRRTSALNKLNEAKAALDAATKDMVPARQ